MHEESSQVPTVPGTPYQGGYYAGTIKIGNDLFSVIVSPKAEGTLYGEWHGQGTAIDGACSFNDGFANTEAMAAAGSELAKSARALAIGRFDDWYIPSRDELELCYRNLKPLTRNNYASYRDGENPSSLPVGYPYAEDSPAQTAAAEFKDGGAQAFDADWYWSSTQYRPGAGTAWLQGFSNGYQYDHCKSYAGRARAVRRFKI